MVQLEKHIQNWGQMALKWRRYNFVNKVHFQPTNKPTNRERFLIDFNKQFSISKQTKIRSKFPEIFSLGWFRKTGPTEEEVRSALFNMWFVGHGYNDISLASQSGKKPDTEVITRVSGPEIGYLTTPITLLQCALIVLSERENLPKGGVLTPGIVFGPTDLQRRLQDNGISFDVISTRASLH